MTWPKEELRKVAAGDDLHIAPLRDDGTTYGTPTWVWSVAVEGDLYVRAYNGTSSRWYQAALKQKAGRIIAAGLTREVAFAPVAGPINDRIDEAYRTKYRGSPYLEPMIGARARAATVKVTPRGREYPESQLGDTDVPGESPERDSGHQPTKERKPPRRQDRVSRATGESRPRSEEH